MGIWKVEPMQKDEILKEVLKKTNSAPETNKLIVHSGEHKALASLDGTPKDIFYLQGKLDLNRTETYELINHLKVKGLVEKIRYRGVWCHKLTPLGVDVLNVAKEKAKQEVQKL